MTSVTVWILMVLSTGNKPLVVIDRFPTPETCAEAREQIVSSRTGEPASHTLCVKATVAR